MRGKKAFTLIELLVVISIIALLLSILMPSLAKVKTQARKVVCKSNIHHWTLPIFSYSADNGGKMPCSMRYDGASGTFPCEIWLQTDDPTGVNPHKGQISWEILAPYMPGFNSKELTWEQIVADIVNEDSPGAEDLRLKGIWTCPANSYDTTSDNIQRLRDRGYFRIQYAYYARVDMWDPRDATHPKDICEKTLKSHNVLFADYIYYWGPWNGVTLYNHGLKGSSPSANGDMHLSDLEGIPEIAGINKAFGDGHVEWKDRKDFDLQGMLDNLDTVPHVNGGASWGHVGTYY